MRLTEIRTEKLLGLFDHVVPLNMDERITIVHGPNGYGKTALLRIVSALFNRQFSVLLELPFESITMAFDNGEILRLRRGMDSLQEFDQPRSIIIESRQDSFEVFHLANITPNSVDEFMPFLTRTGSQEWIDDRTGELLTLNEIAVRFPEHFPPHVRPRTKEMPASLLSLIEGFTVHYIQAHRLESNEKPLRGNRRDRYITPTAAVTRYAAELANRIQLTLGRYAELSQSLDRSFPHRLVAAPGSQLSLDDLRKNLLQLEDRQKKLTDVGLLDRESDPFYSVHVADASKLDVLSIYVADARRKLGVFDDLYSRISLFQKLISKRFLFKTMLIDKQEGFIFRTRKNKPLAATSLSTGEQHELVLLYEMLFRVETNALIVVDEPEISLHIAWQEQFLKDLREITQLSKFDVLIATHSPQIISDRWDLTVELQAPTDA